ncbi:MAG: hypothetical protein IPP71_22290 [Bacteroidetes bacterium]|nr:hypothetical protein [Bacteroidota bacterium]
MTAFSVALGDVPDLAPLIPLSLLGNDIDLKPLTPFGMEWDYFRIKEWTMNGVVAPVSNSHGSLNAFVSGAIYIAPNQIPANNPVAVSVQLDCRNTLGGSKTYFLTSNITVVGDEEYLLVRIDGQEYGYLNDGSTGFFCQLSLSGQLQIIAEMGQGGTQYNVFGLGFDNPSVTTIILNGPTGDNSNLVFFPDAFSAYTMNYEQRTIEPDSSCTRIDRYGSATATLTEYSGPGTITRGFFSGTLYEDNSILSSNCNMPIAHSIEGEFVLMVAPE